LDVYCDENEHQSMVDDLAECRGTIEMCVQIAAITGCRYNEIEILQRFQFVSQLTAWFGVALFAVAAWAATPDIPRLDWQPRSDWINIKKDINPAAVGDGTNDDTTAIQTALNRGSNGKTIYLPPGTYRITQTLVFHGEGTGSAVIGHGRDTRLVWDGPVGGAMFWSDGIAYSRYVGLSWDGQNRAAVGFDHAAGKRFETEILHEHEAFRNFTGYGIRVGNGQKVASAEILYHNCLFDNCGTALGFLTFNDYDNTIDGCEFRNCGTGVLSHKSNFYARNSHFENSRDTDFLVQGEHGSSIRRCTSIGSRRFVQEATIAPLTIQDCRVALWTGREPALYLQGGPVLMFDCVFTPAATNQAALQLGGGVQKLLLSHNQPALVDQLVRNPQVGHIYEIPAGPSTRVVRSASQQFLQETVLVSGKVFDALHDFGAKGEGKTDDTAAIQGAIDAARQCGHGAVAYLPTGRYRVSRTLTISGENYKVEGSGYNCGLVWHGEAGQPMATISDAVNVTLANLVVGMSDWGEMNHGDDVLVTSPDGKPCRVILDGVYAYGMYQKAPDKHGIHFLNLPAGCVVDARHVQGNLRITDCTQAQLLFRTSYEGTVTVEGGETFNIQHSTSNFQQMEDGGRDGLIGFLTRISTASKPALRVRDNNSVVMGDFYNEQSDQVAELSGKPGQPEGRITIQSPKLHLNTTNALFDIRDYKGQIYWGQSQFYCDPKETIIRSKGTQPLQLILAGNAWYQNQPEFELTNSTKLTLMGNVGVPDSASPTSALSGLSSALDDLRHLDALDARLSRMEK
jgi:hypothetical protein